MSSLGVQLRRSTTNISKIARKVKIGVFNNNSSICGKQREVKYKILYNNYRQQDGCSVKDAAGSLQGAASCHTNASQPERGLPLPEHIRAR